MTQIPLLIKEEKVSAYQHISQNQPLFKGGKVLGETEIFT